MDIVKFKDLMKEMEQQLKVLEKEREEALEKMTEKERWVFWLYENACWDEPSYGYQTFEIAIEPVS